MEIRWEAGVVLAFQRMKELRIRRVGREVLRHGMTVGDYKGVEHILCRVGVCRVRVADPNLAKISTVLIGVGDVLNEPNASALREAALQPGACLTPSLGVLGIIGIG